MAKKKPSALAQAASKRLASIGAPQQVSPAEIVHYMMHAEENGTVQRVPLEDGSWAWQINENGQVQHLKPTQEMLAWLHKFETEGHPAH